MNCIIYQLLVYILLIISLVVNRVDARLILDDHSIGTSGDGEKSMKTPSPSSSSTAHDCSVNNDDPVREVMERICDMCHELSSHSRPNTRIECRADCFSTETFRQCLKLFTPRRHNRHLRSRNY